ncbi:MAG: hypothetical protein LBD91_03445 [Prevotellaceae bacterium]|jgi:hypothetical protein|nr:hypothetical protein [Prevotellaceae bacterium]
MKEMKKMNRVNRHEKAVADCQKGTAGRVAKQWPATCGCSASKENTNN